MGAAVTDRFIRFVDDDFISCAAASASRAGPSSRICPAKSEPDLTSIESSESGRRGPSAAAPATPRTAAPRLVPVTQPVNRTKPRTKSPPPPVKPVS